jgi:hypothetical protein
MRRVLAILLLAVLSFSEAVHACSRMTPVPAPDALVARASAIVVAIAARYAVEPAGRGPGRIEFHIERVLQGAERLPAQGQAPLMVVGHLTDGNDFNDRPSPYDFVRPAGRHGSCFADEYRQGARFLLLLGPDRTTGALTPYWEALAPTNEQLHPGVDPWLDAVEAFATRAKPR